MTRPISQREARRLRKLVADMERDRQARLAAWKLDWPGGAHAGTLAIEKDWFWGALRMAAKLGRPLVVKVDDNGNAKFYAAHA